MAGKKSKMGAEGGSIDHLQALIEALANGSDVIQKRIEIDKVNELAVFLGEHQNSLEELTKNIFKNGIPSDATFYERLYKLSDILGRLHFGASEVIGQIWATAFGVTDKSDQEFLLGLLPSESYSFFTLLDAFPKVVSQCRIDPEFAIDLLFKLKERVGNDMANGGLWRGFDSWTANFPDDAFDGLMIVMNRSALNESEISVAAALLGGLRVSWDISTSFGNEQARAANFKDDPDVTKRLVYHRSWINTCRLRGMEVEEFSDYLNRVSEACKEETSEGINFLRCVVGDTRLESDSIHFAIEWLSMNVTTSISDSSKYGVVVAIHAVINREDFDFHRTAALRPILVSALPIPIEHKGTWREMSSLLVSLLGDEKQDFEGWFVALLQADPKGFIPQLKSGGAFESLIRSAPLPRIRKIVTSALFSPNRNCRDFAFALLNEIQIETLELETVSNACDDSIALCIFESRLQHLQADSMFRFLLALRARVKTGSPKLVSFFKSELLYQAKNFPGAVLDGLKEFADKDEMIIDVINQADAYFSGLKLTRNSSINSMEVPGFWRALALKSRRQSKEISSKSEEASIFKQFFTTSYLIYGCDGFRSCIDGEVGSLSKMQETSVSMEMPRLWMIDPEGTAIRRFEAIKSADSLSERISRKPESPNET